MKVMVIDRDSLRELCNANMDILPDVGDTLNIGESPDDITWTQVLKKEWVVANRGESYVLIVVKIKQ